MEGLQTYEENTLRLRTTRVGIFLPQCNEFLGEPLRLLGFVPGCLYGLVRDERGDKVAEEGLPVRGAAVQMPVFQGAAGHCWDVREVERGEGALFVKYGHSRSRLARYTVDLVAKVLDMP